MAQMLRLSQVLLTYQHSHGTVTQLSGQAPQDIVTKCSFIEIKPSGRAFFLAALRQTPSVVFARSLSSAASTAKGVVSKASSSAC